MMALAQAFPPHGIAPILQDLCYRGLSLAGWFVVTAACVPAIWLLFFIMLGDFSFSGTMLQLDNFAARYGRAGADEQQALRQFVGAATSVLLGLVGVLRRHSLSAAYGTHPSRSTETDHG